MNYDAVFHIDLEDYNILNIAISNIDNYYKAIQEKKANVVLLFNGAAVNLLRKENLLLELTELQNKGLVIRVCQNALNKFSLTKEMLLNGIEVVPAGIVELVRLQNEHYAYIKP